MVFFVGGFVFGVGGDQTMGACGSNLPAHLQNSCDNTDKVAMEIWPAWRVGSNEEQLSNRVISFYPSTAALAKTNPKKAFMSRARDLCDTSSLEMMRRED